MASGRSNTEIEKMLARAVRRCFEEAGEGGGYILSPPDHFFEADPELITAYADKARRLIY